MDQEFLFLGTSLVVQWLRLCASNARVMGSILDWGTRIPHAMWRSQKIGKKKKEFLFLTISKGMLMLLVQGPHLENHCFRGYKKHEGL